jgi:hypothetical protein
MQARVETTAPAQAFFYGDDGHRQFRFDFDFSRRVLASPSVPATCTIQSSSSRVLALATRRTVQLFSEVSGHKTIACRSSISSLLVARLSFDHVESSTWPAKQTALVSLMPPAQMQRRRHGSMETCTNLGGGESTKSQGLSTCAPTVKEAKEERDRNTRHAHHIAEICCFSLASPLCCEKRQMECVVVEIYRSEKSAPQ